MEIHVQNESTEKSPKGAMPICKEVLNALRKTFFSIAHYSLQ